MKNLTKFALIAISAIVVSCTTLLSQTTTNVVDVDKLKGYFITGARPTQDQFNKLIDTTYATFDSVTNLISTVNPTGFSSKRLKVLCLGYYTPFDGGGGILVLTNTSTGTNLGTRINSPLVAGYAWDRVLNGEVLSVKHFGALGNDSTDNTAFFASAISVAATTNHGMVFFPAGIYKHAGIVVTNNIILAGEGANRTKLSYVGTGSAISKGASVASISRFGMRDIAVIQSTDGQGGIGIDLDSFEFCDFYNVTVATFRNAGDTGIGVRMLNTHAVCAWNRFINLTIENCDTALLQDSSNATYSTGFSYFINLMIHQEKDCIVLRRTLANGGAYNTFYGVQVQGNGSGAGTGKVIYIEGLGNVLSGVNVDNPGTNYILELNRTDTGGNVVSFIGGFDPAKYVNNQASGAANTLNANYVTHSPGKKFQVNEPNGQLDVNFHSSGGNGLDIQLGNDTSSGSAWRIQMQASATPYLRLATPAGIINEWKDTYHRFYVTTERMRLVAGGLLVEPGNVSSDPVITAAFELRSTNQVFLPMRMTKVQRDAIITPDNGSVVYQTDGTSGLKVYVGGVWYTLNTTADP